MFVSRVSYIRYVKVQLVSFDNTMFQHFQYFRHTTGAAFDKKPFGENLDLFFRKRDNTN